MDALLARLKINNPPVTKQQVEINIRGNPAKEKAKATIIDESKTGFFDRESFFNTLKKVKEPLEKKTVPAPEPAMPEPAMPEPATKKNTTRKIKPTIKISKKPEPAPAVQEPVQEPIQEPAAPVKKATVRKTKKPIQPGEPSTILTVIGDTDIETRLKKRKEAAITIPASTYYMNNREIFVNFIASLFNNYKKDLVKEASTVATCPGDNDVGGFSPMTHQKIVRDYLNLYSPYRGLLLYHGLGSGKTCSSIAIAEGLKNNKPVIIMTPASLQVNYREELKKCGDELYKKNQFWEFITADNADIIETLAQVLSLSKDHIQKNGGAWLVNMTKPANYDQLSARDKLKLDTQIDQMISHKYRFINYNGLRMSELKKLTNNNTSNPFDNSVVIVDEAHNLVSRIVNKLGKKKASIGVSLYLLLMKAKNVKIVLLSGTPIINYPNEIGILFNILRGYIYTWSFKLDILADRQINTAYLQSLFKRSLPGGNILDALEYKPTSTTLMITRNPFGFYNQTAKDNTYAGVKLETEQMSDDAFLALVTDILLKNKIKVQPNGVSMKEYKALPDTLDAFKSNFIEETGELKNTNMFKRRALGLTSYFRSAQESLMPRYQKENPADFQIIKIPMSDFQLGVYEEARVQERTQEKKNALKKKMKKPGVDGLYETTSSTYRIFSRAFCNFVFPQPAIVRPMPDKKDKNGEEATLADAVTQNINEDVLDAVSQKEKADRDEAFDEDEGDDIELGAERASYKDRIQSALEALEKDAKKYLSPEGLQVYSPKFLHILENIQDPDHEGIHLIYTQFRALEGIGILKLILEANGFTQFKIKKVGENWEMDIPEEEQGKPTFALYTGTESAKEKEIIRNVLNNSWKYVPEAIVRKLKEIAPNNNLGEIIKVLMITSSGAEGISLKNVRYVHITEPYWHPVRTEQVIGRARRICSHQALPVELRTVTVFLYLMTFTDTQLKSADTIELRKKDRSRKDDITPVSTDEAIYEIASAKEDITNSILRSVKEASIDCALHIKSNASEKLQCFSFGSNSSSKFAYNPDMEDEPSDAIAEKNQREVKWKAQEIKIGDTMYALNRETNEVYDLDSYTQGQPLKVGNLVKLPSGQMKFEMI